VLWLQGQLKAFRARRFEALNVETLGDELESVVGKYRHEVYHHAKAVIAILMRRHAVYGDWTDLQGDWDMLLWAIKDSRSLAKTAPAQIKSAYRSARLEAALHGEGQWPARCPWRTLEALGRAVRARDRAYRALERNSDPDFANLRPIPFPAQSWAPRRASTRGRPRPSPRAAWRPRG
jgi:hypothetical protein